MKTKILMVFCAVMMGMSSLNTARASVDNSLDVVGDVAFVRPGCFLTTIIGSVVFVVALPFAACSHSVKATADTLVVHPAQATFTRPLGDFSTLN